MGVEVQNRVGGGKWRKTQKAKQPTNTQTYPRDGSRVMAELLPTVASGSAFQNHISILTGNESKTHTYQKKGGNITLGPI